MFDWFMNELPYYLVRFIIFVSAAALAVFVAAPIVDWWFPR